MNFETRNNEPEASRDLSKQVATHAGYVVARQETRVYQVPYDGTESNKPVVVEEVLVEAQRANLVA